MIAPIRRSLSALCFAVTLAAAAEPACAESEEDRSAARALATQGIAAHRDGRYAEALDLFSRAETLVHAPPHLLYMARSAAKVGQLVRARELYLKLTREELAANAPQAFRDAQTEARQEVKAIEPRLANLKIVVKAPQGLTYKVEMDERTVSAAVVGVPFPADPGLHRLKATAPGYESKPVEVNLVEGGQGQAELVLAPTSAAPSGAGAPGGLASTGTGVPAQNVPNPSVVPQEPARAESGPRTWMRPVSFAALGLGVVGLGAGTYFGLTSRSERKDADELANQCGSPCSKSDPLATGIANKDDDARKHMTLSIVGFVVGGVGVATGATLFVLSSRQGTQSARTIAPFIGWRSAGLSGTW